MMKTQAIKIILGIVFAGSVTLVSGSELAKIAPFTDEVTENDLSLEPWMTLSILSESESACAGSLVDIALSNPDFSILAAAVSKAGLAEKLSTEGPFTVFAPTNKAFETLFEQLEVSGISDLTADQLVPILTYHVVSGELLSSNLLRGEIETLNKTRKLVIDVTDGVKINESRVIQADIKGKNGIIHAVDNVLLPQ
jgi:uncharacterized surface protein with fasciclin (FAS1) repeats